jgi:hypothetical protein
MKPAESSLRIRRFSSVKPDPTKAQRNVTGGDMETIVPIEVIEGKILLIRGQKVMLDADLAELYGLPTKALKQAVKRNLKRFPSDFMFILTYQEVRNLRSQFVTSNVSQHGGSRYALMVFTEQGVAMLSSVLNSDRAIEVNILIIRAFVKLREMVSSNKDLARSLEEMEKKYDKQFKIVFESIRALMAPPERPRKKIGFLAREPRARYGRK